MPFTSNFSNNFTQQEIVHKGAYHRRTYTDKYLLKFPVEQIYTNHPSYLDLFKCIVEIYDKDRITLLHKYSMFDPENQTSILQEVNISNSNISKSFTVKFVNDGDNLNENIIGLGNFIKIYGGKDVNNLFFLVGGYVIDREPSFYGNSFDPFDEYKEIGIKDYTLHCEGEKAQFNNLIGSFRRASTTLEDIDDPNVIRLPDSNMTIFNMLQELLTKKDVRITKDFAIKDFLNLNLSRIDQTLDEKILSISEQMREVTEIINFLASLVNAFWDIEDGKFIFEHPHLRHSGIILRHKAQALDLANAVSYFIGNWNYHDSISKSSGHANGIYNISSADSKSVASQNKSSFSTVLYQRALAQRFSAIDTRFSSLILIMSKIGTPFDSETPIEKQVVRGEIRIDNNGEPTGPVISTFEIPISSISDTKDNIFVNDLAISSEVLSPNTQYWILLFPVGKDLANTVRWYHDGIITHNDPTHFSSFAVAINEEITDSSTLDWRTSQIGPTFTFNIFSKIKRTQYFSDSDSIDQFGLREDVVEFAEIEDPLSITRLMQSLIALRSRPIRRYTANEVTIPNGKIFKPGQTVTIVHEHGQHQESKNVFAIIQEVRYHWSVDDDSSILGLFKCEILPVGFLDFKIEELFTI